ncbi:hypothetical protein [Shewanella nanhaiensis]|uniref:Uncharacterized protein n=1 Tax=Shewanella nanhaiensis TaxID=2864872 RepID=A0ABS7E8Q0_9GAMM|nr:hypothetical protein [Shewanella nanhaiensis]MBW8186071.1 hypothetical protein [Shewanella nanhaiensis]
MHLYDGRGAAFLVIVRVNCLVKLVVGIGVSLKYLVLFIAYLAEQENKNSVVILLKDVGDGDERFSNKHLVLFATGVDGFL